MASEYVLRELVQLFSSDLRKGLEAIATSINKHADAVSQLATATATQERHATPTKETVS